ncbi:hypothetical protein GMD78_05705 [Ornithinibacillus sp. L9]|uniref:Uncharacterized protein n=1 Tax=Ornithinibacillus caprae TaxID=2678566 RepID=A0A6N8FEE8_9BACI|nr:DUF6054 family protein [Ornithinibacillus caprae]MUK87893.1 hypothetical protein [Ornithinibacillus caprae]
MMKYVEFKVSLEPYQAFNKLMSDIELKSCLVFNDRKSIKFSNEEMFILVYEKYYLRINSTASLTVTLDNLNGETIVKCISTGNSEGLLNISWGADKQFIKIVEKILEPNLEEVIKET